MASHPYLRFLARVSARQPLLRPPPDANLTQVNPSDFLSLIPYTHPISGYRSRSFELRKLELRIAEVPSVESLQGPSSSSPLQRTTSLSTAATAGSATFTTSPLASAADGGHAAVRNLQERPHGSRESGAKELPNAAPEGPDHRDSSHTPPTSSIPTADTGVPSQPKYRQHQDPQEQELRPRQPQFDDATVAVAVAGAAALPDGAPRKTGEHSGAPRNRYPPSPPKDAGRRTTVKPHTSAALLPSPPHSYMEIHYPFTELPWLWRQYHRAGFPGLDPALIIEDFDTFAADVAARHVGHVPDSMLVTAFLERLTWHVHLRPGDGLVPPGVSHGGGSAGGQDGLVLASLAPTDMRLAGQVTWVGRSSMEVLLQLTTTAVPTTHARKASQANLETADLLHHSSPALTAGAAPAQAPPPPSQLQQASSPLVVLPPGQLVATAEFVMALRDSSLRRAVDIPPLHPRDELEREYFQRGRQHQQQRQARRDKDREAAALSAAKLGSLGCSPQLAASPAPFSAVDATAAATPDPDLARMLYDSVLQSDLARTVPKDVDMLRLMEIDPELDHTQEPVMKARGHSPVRSKRLRTSYDQQRDVTGSWVHSGHVGSLEHTATTTAARAAVDESSSRSGCDAHATKAQHGSSHNIPKVVAKTQDSSANTAVSMTPLAIHQTEVHRTVIAEFQDRNTSGTVFGGHLLRLAYEQAATAAAAFAGGTCELLWLEEGAISSPARMGDVLHAVARVVWAEQGGRALRIMVRVGKYNVTSPSQHVLALTLAATFLAPSAQLQKESAAVVAGVPTHMNVMDTGKSNCGSGLRGMVPRTLTEAGEALAAQRRHDAVIAALVDVESLGGASLGDDPRPCAS